MKNIVTVLITLLMLVSCKNEKTKKVKNGVLPKESVETIKKDNRVTLSFKGVFNLDDSFLVYYATEKNQRYSTKNVLTKKIKGSAEEQEIELVFPENTVPYDLRVDFSDNKDQKEISFQNLKISDSLNTIIVDAQSIKTYFNFNKGTDLDVVNSTLKTSEFLVEGNTLGYNPYLNSNLTFRQKLNVFNQANQNKQKIGATSQELNLTDGKFRVIIEGVFKSDDVILLFHTNDLSTGFKKAPVREKVSGSNEEQTIVLTLPDDDFLVNFRLDISDNVKQEGIEINKVSFIEDEINVSFGKLELSKHLKGNEYIDLNPASGNIQLKSIKEGSIEKYNPYFVVTNEMIKKLSVF